MTQSKDRIQGKRLNLSTSPKIIKLRRLVVSSIYGGTPPIETPQKSKLAVVKKIPTDLIEEKTLELLGVVVIDRENYDDLVVPHRTCMATGFTSEQWDTYYNKLDINNNDKH